jgi:hypothetical protein
MTGRGLAFVAIPQRAVAGDRPGQAVEGVMKRVAGVIIGVVALVGMKFYNKASAHDDVRVRLVQLCEGDNACQTAVSTHYEACFDSSYKMGGRRRSSSLDLNTLVKCVNSRSGEEYFTVDEK